MKHRSSRRTSSIVSGRAPAAVLVLTLVLALAAGLVGCGGSAGDATTSTGAAADRQPSELVRDFFAGEGAEIIRGLTITELQVAGEASAIDLTLKIHSDGSDDQLWTLNGLIFGAMKGNIWPTAFEAATGLTLAWLHAEVDYPSGAPDIVDVDVEHSLLSAKGGAPRYHMGGPDTTAEQPSGATTSAPPGMSSTTYVFDSSTSAP
jgi:hypothetical protein